MPSTTPITRPAPRPELQQTATTPQTVQQLSAPVLPQPPKPLPPPPKPQVGFSSVYLSTLYSEM